MDRDEAPGSALSSSSFDVCRKHRCRFGICCGPCGRPPHRRGLRHQTVPGLTLLRRTSTPTCFHTDEHGETFYSKPRSLLNEWRCLFTLNPHQHSRLWTRLLATHGAFYTHSIRANDHVEPTPQYTEAAPSAWNPSNRDQEEKECSADAMLSTIIPT